MNTPLLGTSFIGRTRSSGTELFTHGIVPGAGTVLEPAYLSATPEEVARAMSLASSAFPAYSSLSGKTRAAFLRAIAAEIETVTDDIVERGELEAALSESRLRSETARTTGHFRMFADLIEDGSWVGARITRGQPDIRSMLCPLGPVAVFCASNFPVAYSVAGGDTASALAAGCPVIVIAHEAHPGVAEIAASAIIRAATMTGMPDGVFSLLYGGGPNVGKTVVEHPATRAVGFTGSRAGGTALMKIAAARPQPIPVFAEMSSVNPIVILPGALARGEETLARAFFESLTNGVGQFCTNPGLVFLPMETGERFLSELRSLIGSAPPGVMLHAGIHRAFLEATAAVANTPGVETFARAGTEPGPGEGAPAVFTVSITDFLAHPGLQKEMFGPATLIVRGTLTEIQDAIPTLEGQLTATLHATDRELLQHTALVSALRDRAGRLVFNGFPTGVRVCESTVHGGPFPATSDGRSTSVGTMAITRFCRPAAWQDCPQTALPPELRDANPLGIRRLE